MEVGERGDQELLEAKKIKEEIAMQSEILQSQLAELRGKEQQMAVVSSVCVNTA